MTAFVTISTDDNIGKKEHEKTERFSVFWALKEQVEQMWSVKAKVLRSNKFIGALGAVTSTLEEWLLQFPDTTSEVSVQKSVVLGTAKILC